jgi:hypothetical protein
MCIVILGPSLRDRTPHSQSYFASADACIILLLYPYAVVMNIRMHAYIAVTPAVIIPEDNPLTVQC